MSRSALSDPVRHATLYLSQVLGQPVLDAQGERLARVQDFVARFGTDPHPPVSGLVARGGRRDFYLSWDAVTGTSSAGIRLATFKVDLRPFERRDGEVLLRHDILDKQLIDVDGRRVVRANDLLLTEVETQYRLVGVDVSVQALWRRLAPAALTKSVVSHRLIDWADVESFATDVPMVRLRVNHHGVSKLHPVEIAQIVDALSPRQGQELLESLNDEIAADTVQELDPDDAADLLARLDRERAADILDEMDPDDAADVLANLPEHRSEELLGLMEPDESEDVRELLAYSDDTAAGLMTTDFVAIAPDLTAGEAMTGLRAIPEPPEPIYHIYLVDAAEPQHLVGVVALRDLILVPPATSLRELAGEHEVRSVHRDAPARDVARMMAEFNLATLPVVDEENVLLGIVVVDDAMDVLLPDLWLRRLSARMFHT